MLTLDEVRSEALNLIEGVKEGEPLNARTEALIGLALRASPTLLDGEGIDDYTRQALATGSSAAQIHETLVLVSGLGVHTFMEGSRRVGAILREHGEENMTTPLNDYRQQLWAKHVGDDPFWDVMEREVPGFLETLLRLSPEAFAGFFQYCAIPWQTASLRAITKELIALAVDAAPSHRFLPGIRLHLGNAIKLGAGRTAILQTLDLAAAAPAHNGVR